ncbi:lipase, class 3 [Pseudohyphozyma bogoriensis]|nr:lipase, class 3 [Pseudohyphozyma bogoriensis]
MSSEIVKDQVSSPTSKYKDLADHGAGGGVSAHLAELENLRSLGSGVYSAKSASTTTKSRFSVPLSLVNYVFKALHSLLNLLVFSPQSILGDPVSTIATFIIYPVIVVALSIFVVVFWISGKLGGGKIIEWLGRKWGGGYSVVNWLNPTIFGPHSVKVVNSARPYLAGRTSPSDFAEVGFFLVDATITRVSSQVFFGAGSGTCHEGFYTDLFPGGDGEGGDGYGMIIRHIRKTAERLKTRDGRPVPLWVTGHSLGSALASLLYARFIHSPTDLGPNIVLRDCYSFGTPLLGDGSFAGAFTSQMMTPLNRPNILWRVVDNFDIVCRVPPGVADKESQRDILGPSILNYSHIGVGIQLNGRLSFPPHYMVDIGEFHGRTKVVVVDDEETHGRGRRMSSRWDIVAEAGVNPLRIGISLLPLPLYDHFPAAYWRNINIIGGSQPPFSRTPNHSRHSSAAGSATGGTGGNIDIKSTIKGGVESAKDYMMPRKD